jgi:hypothetical protein
MLKHACVDEADGLYMFHTHHLHTVVWVSYLTSAGNSQILPHPYHTLHASRMLHVSLSVCVRAGICRDGDGHVGMLTRTWESTHVSMRGARLPDNAKFLMASRRSEMLVRLGLGLGHGLTVELNVRRTREIRCSVGGPLAFSFPHYSHTCLKVL